jgi:aspartate aminotransferase-like enzyme
LLFTPVPVSTAKSVKEAALTELGSGNAGFIMQVQQIRYKLLKLAHVETPEYEAVIISGSGLVKVIKVISVYFFLFPG